MAFHLADSWVWDFWLADDGERYHLFFLFASRALGDPERRHYRASVGHAVSEDLVTWERVADALVRSDAPAADDLATWTGSVVRADDGTWRMFYTSASLVDGKNRQTVSVAQSGDLMTWERVGPSPLLAADPERYEVLTDNVWHDEAFRDPWVFRADGAWHMLVTARAREGEAFERGVVGHAVSSDLASWDITDPLTQPGCGFGQLEVMQVEEVDGTPVLLFSCLATDASEAVRASGLTGGTWACPAESLTGPFDVAAAYPLTDRTLYSGRIIRRRDTGTWAYLAFRHDGPDGEFVGTITDPMPASIVDGRLVVDRSARG